MLSGSQLASTQSNLLYRKSLPLIASSSVGFSSGTTIEEILCGLKRVADSSVQKITVEADDVIKARLMLEAKYGKENVIFVGRA